MRALLLIVVLAVAGFAAYQYGYKGEPPPRSVAEATGQAREALQEASLAVAPAARQAADAVREGAQRLQSGTGDPAADARAELAQESTEIGNQMREAVGRARAALVSATSGPTAEAQLPVLNDVNAKLASLQARLDALPAEARGGFAGLAADALPGARDIAERVKALEGTGPGFDGALDAMLSRLEGWSRPPA